MLSLLEGCCQQQSAAVPWNDSYYFLQGSSVHGLGRA